MAEPEISIIEREETERKEILKKYKSLLRSIRHELTIEQKRAIRAAFDLALDAHKDMRRKSGEPYIYHPIAVARIAAQEIGLGTTSIVCALIHDVVEDSDYTIEDIKRKFGEKTAKIVDGLTKIKEVFDHTDSMQAENFRKMLLTLSDDVRVILVKLCDRLHNMRTLDSMSRKNQLKIASETLFLYAPLAHRLGLYNVKSELEDLSIKYTQREAYKEISAKLNAKKAERDRFVRKFIEPIKKRLEETDLKFEIKGRPKSIYSILKKMNHQDIPFEQVYDLFAIRIILTSPPEKEKTDCWTAYSIVTDIYKPNPSRTRDWITTPKSNGYESLHTTVMSNDGKWVEVQIRTDRMDEIAEKGFAAHWKYKNTKDGIENDGKAGGVDGWLARIKDILENPSTNALEFLDDFKLQLIHEEIFVFTPNGDLKKLPKGATALDFAFEIHTQVGSKCIGAKLNNRLVPLSHQLSNGDQVEILTSEKQHPRDEWLSFVITGKAIARIRNFLRESKRDLAEKGKETLRKRFHKEKIDFNEDNIQKLVRYFKVQSPLDLFYAINKELIASEKLLISDIINKKISSGMVKVQNEIDKSPQAKKGEIIVGEEYDLPYNLAKCCNPIPGDDIFGFITIGEGVKIHRTNCPNAVSLMSNYGYRIIKAQWKDTEVRNETKFLAGLKLMGIDDVGIVSSLADIISKNMGVNMKAITIESHDGTFEGTISVFVEGTKHLDNLISNIKQKHPTMNVFRIEIGA
jgi:guanosine-3',5'-bis(diphosphate) 3'-pyrophosphohydrolase